MIQFADDKDNKKEELSKERKQILGFLEAVKGENYIIGRQLAPLVKLISKMRVSYLSIEELVTDFEAKLTK